MVVPPSNHPSNTWGYTMRGTYVALGSILLAAGALAQDTPPVFTTTSELVLVDAQVIHKKTRTAAPALRKDDFRIFEDAAARDISFFSRDELPLSIVLLFDVT